MSKFPVLKLNKEFRTLYYHGHAEVHPLLVTYIRRSRRPVTRVGITTGKKAGGAVQRSRCRRIIRAAYRSLMPEIRGHWDIVFVARAKTATVKSTELCAIMRRHLTAGGVIV